MKGSSSDRQHRDEERIGPRERRYRDVLDALPAAIYVTDAAGKITYCNQAAVELAGRNPRIGEDEWCVTFRLFTPEGKPLPHEACPMAVALREDRPVRGCEALAQRPDGTLVPFLPFPTPIHDKNGALLGAVNMLVDISERKQADARLRLLLDELNHRVKNNMQMLHSLLQVALRESCSPEAQRTLAEVSQRLAALAAAQTLLYSEGHPRSLTMAEFLRAVSGAAKQAFGKEVAVELEAGRGQLSIDASMPLALILNELLANAAKHGVNGRRTGSILVALKRDQGEILLSVQDDGPGFEPVAAARRSSGLGLVRGLVQQLHGSFTVESGNGARCVVRFPEKLTG